jgi:hypothetical protein
MKTKDDVENLEKLIGQLSGLHAEIFQLAKKSPNDGLNVIAASEQGANRRERSPGQ